MGDSSVVFPAFELILVAKNLERVADHSTNIAEDVIYMVVGSDVRHPAVDRQLRLIACVFSENGGSVLQFTPSTEIPINICPRRSPESLQSRHCYSGPDGVSPAWLPLFPRGGRDPMNLNFRWPLVIGLLAVFVLASRAQTQRDPAAAQTHKPVMITRLYTGTDGLTHAEEIEANFAANGASNLGVTGAELHRMSPSTKADWHPGPRRQYVITLSGSGEIEVAAAARKSRSAPATLT